MASAQCQRGVLLSQRLTSQAQAQARAAEKEDERNGKTRGRADRGRVDITLRKARRRKTDRWQLQVAKGEKNIEKEGEGE